jgi:pyroglutamyl-peptidase
MFDKFPPAEARSERRLRVLVTGFGSFPGAPVNPTRILVRALEKGSDKRLRRLGVDLMTAVLPVVYADAQARIAELVAATRPDLIIHLGLAARRPTITVEQRGLNRVSVLHPDAERRLSSGAVVERGGAGERRGPALVTGVIRAISLCGAPAKISRDAGDYVCNQTFYISLGLTPHVMFIHMPRPRRRARLRSAPTRAATLAQMTRGVEAAIVFALSRLRHQTPRLRLDRVDPSPALA